MPTPRAPRDTDEPPPRVSRWRAAWRVLTGESVVPDQIFNDWLTYRLMFDDLLKRFGAMLARQAKADHARLREALQDEPSHRAPATPATRKEEVRRRAAEMRGLAPFRGTARAPEVNHVNRLAPILHEPVGVDDDEPDEEEESP